MTINELVTIIAERMKRVGYLKTELHDLFSDFTITSILECDKSCFKVTFYYDGCFKFEYIYDNDDIHIGYINPYELTAIQECVQMILNYKYIKERNSQNERESIR